MEALPPSVRQRLDRCADRWLHERDSTPEDSAPGSGAVPADISSHARRSPLPWLIAAASLLLAVMGWWPQLVEPDPAVAAAGQFGQWRAQFARERMLASSDRVGHWAWDGDASTSSGDVVWDNARQRGFLRLKGFVANDPARARYQLWIFDAARDDRYPIDGGMFDVPPGREEVIVPVVAAVPVLRPVAFAVTVEGPRGAVVSERDKVVAVAHADR
jgi:hypothetical protein